jgi:pimeloyl-ACP methyl ester carboxylesterase
MKTILKKILIACLGNYINTLSYIAPTTASRLAYKLFSEPREGKLTREKLPLFLQSAQSEFIELEQHRFPVYIWQGNEQKVLLVHGWESNAGRWELLFPHLQLSGSTIIALDAPAHGLANGKEFNVPRYATFLNQVIQKYAPSILIGHSMGGATCLYYQHHYPNTLIQKMILLGAPSDLKVLIQNFVSLLKLNTKMMHLIENHFIEKFKIRLDDFTGKTMGASLRIDGIIVHDEEDGVVAFSEGQKIANSWKNAIFIKTKGLGHSMHDEALYQSICEFLFKK